MTGGFTPKGKFDMDKSNILLVDNDSATIYTLQSILDPLDITLVCADSAETALRSGSEQDFAVIVIDAQLHSANAYELARDLAQRSSMAAIIVLTSHNSDIARIFDGEPSSRVDCLLKPVIPEMLRARVRLFIELFHQSKMVQQQKEEIQRLNDYIDRHRAIEDNVFRQNYWLQTALTSIGDAVLTTDREGRISFLNPAAERLTGWSQDEARGKEADLVLRLVDQRTRLPAVNPLTNVLKDELVVRAAHHISLIAKDGREISVEESVAPIRDNLKQTIGAVLVFRDVTTQKDARQIQAQFAAIVAGSNDAIISKDLNGIILSWNKGAERIFGYTGPEMIGKPISVLVPPGYHNDVLDILERIKRGERIEHYETKRRRKDGVVLDVSLTVSPIFDDEANVIGASKIARDITEQKRNQMAQAQLAAIVESSEDAIISRDLNGIITSWNKAAEQMYGYTAVEAIGQPITIIVPPDLQNDVPQILERIRKGERIAHYQTKRRAKDGRVLDVSLTVSPIRDMDGNIVGASKIAREIREGK
jgi:PAS domain S-box-containing protein